MGLSYVFHDMVVGVFCFQEKLRFLFFRNWAEFGIGLGFGVRI